MHGLAFDGNSESANMQKRLVVENSLPVSLVPPSSGVNEQAIREEQWTTMNCERCMLFYARFKRLRAATTTFGLSVAVYTWFRGWTRLVLLVPMIKQLVRFVRPCGAEVDEPSSDQRQLLTRHDTQTH